MSFLVYIGWIYGDSEDRAILKRLGVKGEMIWSERTFANHATVGRKRGIIEHCECTEKILDRLEQEYTAFCRDSFTKTDEREYRKYRRQFE